MTTERLTSLAAVKAWLNITSDASDAQLTLVIDAVSQFVLSYLGWDTFRRRTYTQNFRGNGKSSVLLRNWPILGVTSVASAGATFPASTFNNFNPSSGYVIGDQRGGMQSLDLIGYGFARGAYSTVVYEAGFETTQTLLVPATPHQFTPYKDGTWNGDLGVTLDGVDATAVLGTPVAGEYSVDEWGLYTFAAADEGKTAVISYSYVPAVISFAAMEMTAEFFKRKDHIGIQSKTLGGQETITYTQGDMNPAARSMLQPYMNVVPA